MDENEKQGQTLEGDEISYDIYDDEEEDIHDYTVRLVSLGYIVYFRMDTPQAAIDLFESMKHVKEIEAD